MKQTNVFIFIYPSIYSSRLSERTFSLWGYMANHMNEYINPLYSTEDSGIIIPVLYPQNIKYAHKNTKYTFFVIPNYFFYRFWRGMYCRFESGVHPREPLGDLLLATCDHSSSLEDHIKYLTKVNLVFNNYINK